MRAAGASVTACTVRDLLASTTRALGSASEARWIVERASALSAGDLVLRLDSAVSPATSEAVRDMVDRRLGGEPLQYVLGTWGFRTLDVGVDRRALIPRPETEQVVEAALDELSVQARRVATGCSDHRHRRNNRRRAGPDERHGATCGGSSGLDSRWSRARARRPSGSGSGQHRIRG